MLGLVALLLGALAGWLAPPAFADHNPESCIYENDMSVIGWEYSGASFDNNSKGTSASIWAPDTSAQMPANQQRVRPVHR